MFDDYTSMDNCLKLGLNSPTPRMHLNPIINRHVYNDQTEILWSLS